MLSLYAFLQQNPLFGSRSSIRVVSPEDAPRIVEMANRYPVNTRNFSFFEKPLTLEREEAYLQSQITSPRDIIFVIESPDGAELYGTCGLHDIDFANGQARLGYILFNSDSHGQGIIQEAVGELLFSSAFGVLGLNKIYINVFVDNIPALRSDLNLNFRFEGQLREFYRVHGEYKDAYYMGLLKREWEARRNRDATK